jgi:DNA-binding transcriptional ArsR family regulator
MRPSLVGPAVPLGLATVTLACGPQPSARRYRVVAVILLLQRELYALTGICLVEHAWGVNSVFEVLAEPRRRQILDLVRGGECSVNELVARLEMNQPAVSKHLRVLREAGLVRVRVDEQRRLYRLSPAPLRELDRWLAPYRAAWEASLDKLERHLDQMTDDETGEGR